MKQEKVFQSLTRGLWKPINNLRAVTISARFMNFVSDFCCSHASLHESKLESATKKKKNQQTTAATNKHKQTFTITR